jgi:hypothetical protein
MPYLFLLKEPTTERVSWVCCYTFSYYNTPFFPKYVIIEIVF